jgi:hypothetical protein
MDPLRRGVIAKHELLQVLTFMGLRCSAQSHPMHCNAPALFAEPSAGSVYLCPPTLVSDCLRTRARFSATATRLGGHRAGRSARPSSDDARLRVRRVAAQHCRCAACEPQALHRPLHRAQVDYGAFTASLLRRLSPRVTALIKSTWARFEVVSRLLCIARPRSIRPRGQAALRTAAHP